MVHAALVGLFFRDQVVRNGLRVLSKASEGSKWTDSELWSSRSDPKLAADCPRQSFCRFKTLSGPFFCPLTINLALFWPQNDPQEVKSAMPCPPTDTNTLFFPSQRPIFRPFFRFFIPKRTCAKKHKTSRRPNPKVLKTSSYCGYRALKKPPFSPQYHF